MSTQKQEVIITCNTQQPVAAVRAMEAELKKLKVTYQQLSDSGKAGTERAKKMAHDIKELSIAVKEGKDNMDRIVKVTNDLSNSSLSQLNRALRQVKKEMGKVSTDSPKLDDLRAKYKAITDQIKILQGEMLNIGKNIGNLSSQSDAWLNKAIQQTKSLMQQTKQGTSAYEHQRDVLSQLSNEQAKRAMSTINSGTASADSLRTARQNLAGFRDSIGSGGVPTADRSSAVQAINAELKKADEQLDAIAGKEKQVEKTTQQIAQDASAIAMDPNKFTPKEIETSLADVNKQLKNMAINDPMRKQLVESAKKLRVALDGVDRETVDVNMVMKNLRSTPIDKLQQAAKRLENEMKTLQRDTTEYANKSQQLRQVRAEIDRATNSVKAQSSAWNTTLKNLTAYFGLFQLFSMVQQKLTAVFRLNLKFSDQLADIRKVSGLAMQDINRLSENLAKLDTRTTIEELNQIAYAGAKLGIGKYGTEGLEQFVRAANQVNVALKEDLGADALTALSKITEVMGLIPKMGVEKSMLAVGSAMFQLSATSTATSNNIVEFAKRLTGMARTAGITTDQLLALGSASDSMYLMPEVASTAFNKLISSLQTKHNLIEKELQIAPGTINELYSAGRAIDAIVLIFEKMREKGNMNALQGVFKDLGSDGARLVNVMVTMSKNVDMLKEHLNTSSVAFEEATAVSKEYAIQQQTAQALMERASNIWEKAFVNPEGVDMVKEMAQAWYDFSKNTTSSQASMLVLKGLLDVIAIGLKAVLALLPAILSGLLFKGVAAAVTGVASSIGLMGKASVVATFQTNGLTAAWKALNVAQKANYIGLAISLLVALGTAIYDVVQKGEKMESWMSGFNPTMSDFNREFSVAEYRLKLYRDAILKAKDGSHEHSAAIKNFNKEFGGYLTNLLNEKSAAKDVAMAYEEVVKHLRAKIALQLREKDIEKEVTPRVGWAADRLSEYDEKANGHENGRWLKGYVDDAFGAGKGIYEIAKDLQKKWGVIPKVFDFGLKHRSDNQEIPTGWRFKDSDGKYKVHYLNRQDEQFIRAMRYIAQQSSVNAAQRRVNRKWQPYEDDINNAILSPVEETPGTLDNNAPDNDALRRAKEEARKQKEAWRKDLEDAQDQARAVIDNIKNFYQRQITEVLRTAKEQNWDTALTESAVRAVEGRMNLALSQARKSIAGVENSWDDFKKTMETDLKEKADEVGYNESQVLLDKINATNTKKLHDFIAKLSANLGLPGNAATDAIWKNASLNEKANETAEQKRRKEVQKRLLDDNYTAKVDNEYTQSMETLGFFDLDEEQTAILLGKDVEKAKKMLAERDVEIKKVFENARTNIVQILNSDVQTSKGYVSFMEAIFGKGWDQEESQLKEVFNLYGDDLQVFYNELIKYSDSYTEALKKSRERQKKILDEQWMKTDFFHQNEDKQKDMETFSSGVSQYDYRIQKRKENGEYIPRKDTYGTGAFVSSMGIDPEVESYRLKMEAAQAYYDFCVARQADAEILRDREQELLRSEMEYAKSVAEQMKQRMNDMYALAEPIEDFGTSVGEAFATMTEDSEAGRKAMKAAVGDMIKAFMKQTVEMTKEYAKRSIMQKMNDRLTSTKMKKSADQMVRLEDSKQKQITQTQEQGGQAQKFLNERVQGDIQKATAEIGQETLQEHKANVTEEVNTESAKTQANTTMGIASGASKIIGSLGWWGIPLVAVITALLNGLLSFAMSKVSSLFGGGGDKTADAGPNVKLVTGMLTYDSGNVQAFRGVEDGQTYPVVGNDGHVYAAKDGGELSTGLVRDPITTLINGQPALVAERGPEMVIGRETTAAMMMARPDLLAEIVKFDRSRSGMTYRAYDSGNVQGFPATDGVQPAGLSPEDVAALRTSLDNFAAVMTLIQRNGLHVNKFGRGSITEEAVSGAAFMRRNSGDRRWK